MKNESSFNAIHQFASEEGALCSCFEVALHYQFETWHSRRASKREVFYANDCPRVVPPRRARFGELANIIDCCCWKFCLDMSELCWNC